MTTKNIEDLEIAWTVSELANALQVNPKSIEAACREGRIEAMKIVGHWRIPSPVARCLVTARRPGHRPEASKIATCELLQELDSRQDTALAVITFDEQGVPGIDGILFEECTSGHFYKRQIGSYLRQAHSERKYNPQRPSQIDPPEIFKISGRII